MKIVNVCYKDWSRFMFDNAKALQSVGVDCKAFVFKSHEYYTADEQAEAVSHERMIAEIHRADIVQVFHTQKQMEPYVKDLKKPVIIYHTASDYRKYPQHYNEMWNPIVEKSVICLGEFHKLGAKNEVYLVGAVDTDLLQPHIGYKGIIKTVAHYPSNERKKGTPHIQKIVASLARKLRGKFTYKSQVRIVPFQDNLKRMSECDIYLELFKLKLDHKTYGSWGITALEAAALGKVVITNHLAYRLYKAVYGECMIQHGNDVDQFSRQLAAFIKMDKEKLIDYQQRTRDWVVEKHSYKATGKRIKDVILEL